MKKEIQNFNNSVIYNDGSLDVKTIMLNVSNIMDDNEVPKSDKYEVLAVLKTFNVPAFRLVDEKYVGCEIARIIEDVKDSEYFQEGNAAPSDSSSSK